MHTLTNLNTNILHMCAIGQVKNKYAHSGESQHACFVYARCHATNADGQPPEKDRRGGRGGQEGERGRGGGAGCQADLDPGMIQGPLHSQAGFGVQIQQSHHQVLGRGGDGTPVLGPHLGREKGWWLVPGI